MYYIVYKTTNAIDDKVYVGIHKTKTKEFDGYLGSGLLLLRAIKKWGAQNFTRETMFYCESWETARKKERELVTLEFCESALTYNISVGGTGGNTIAGHSEARKKDIRQKRVQTSFKNGNYHFSGEKLKLAQERMLSVRIQPDNKNRKHSKEAKKNISAANKMRKAKWITNGIDSALLYPENTLPEGWKLGRPACVRTTAAARKHTLAAKEKIARANFGQMWYNNGKINVRTKNGPPPGFVRGAIQAAKKTKWITNGITSVMIDKIADLPIGWRIGRTIKRK